MKLTIGQKAMRVVKFLMGLRHPQVVKALAQHGFTQEQVQRGWALLGGLTEVSFDGLEREPGPNTLVELDRFENTWFPIARATLAHHYPEVGAALFRNLPQTQGREVAVTVAIFLDRLGRMQRGEGEFGVAGPAARRLLAERGLRGTALAEGAALIESLQTVRPIEPLRIDREREQQAEAALWAWYLEWSAIARVAIRDRRMLRALGFLNSKRHANAEEGDTDGEFARRHAGSADIGPN